jgi:hypothetical protein
MAADLGITMPVSYFTKHKCWAVVLGRSVSQLAGRTIQQCGHNARKGMLTCVRHDNKEKEAQELKALREQKPTSEVTNARPSPRPK